MEKSLLEKYLLETAVFDPALAPADHILNNDELLSAVENAWTTSGDAIKAVIRERLKHIRTELVMSASPYEVLPLRQALVEVAALIEDFENYAAEADNRRKARDQEGNDEEASPPEDGVEDTNS